MKKLLSKLTIVALASLFIVGCEKPNGELGGQPTVDDDELTDSQLTPGEHQQKLEQTAKDLIAYFNPADQEQIVKSLSNLSEYLDSQQKYSVAKMSSAFHLQKILDLSVEDPASAAMMAMILAAEEEFVFSLNGYGGISYKFNKATYNWIESVTDDNKIEVKWDETVVSLTWVNSDKYWTSSVVVEDTLIKVAIPSQVTLLVTIGGEKELELVVTPNYVDNYSMNPVATLWLKGGYTITAKVQADRNGVGASVILAKNGTVLIANKATANISDLTDPANWMETDTWYNGSYYEEYRYCNIGEYFIDNCNDVFSQVDILNLTLVGKGDVRTLYTKIGECYDKYTNEFSKECSDEICKITNENASVYLYYNDSNAKIANLVLQTARYNGDYYDGDKWTYGTYYEPELIIEFADGTKHSIYSYFTEERFDGVLEAAYDLVERYMDILAY